MKRGLKILGVLAAAVVACSLAIDRLQMVIDPPDGLSVVVGAGDAFLCCGNNPAVVRLADRALAPGFRRTTYGAARAAGIPVHPGCVEKRCLTPRTVTFWTWLRFRREGQTPSVPWWVISSPSVVTWGWSH